MPEYLAPGVYVEEVSFRSKSIEGVSTSTAAFAGPTRKGPFAPLDPNARLETPELITSVGDFERVFGGLEDLALSVPTNYVAHAVRAFFDNGGSRLYCSRLFVPSAGNVASSPNRSGDAGAERQVRVVARFPGRALRGRVVILQKEAPATARTLERASIGSLLRVSATDPGHAAILEGGTPPFSVPSGGQLLLTVSGAPADITFRGAPAEATAADPLDMGLANVDANPVLTVTIDGFAQTITLPAGTRPQDVEDRLNAPDGIRGGYARMDNGRLAIGSDRRGSSASVIVDPNPVLGFTQPQPAEARNTAGPNNNVGDIGRITPEELNALFTAGNIGVRAALNPQSGRLALRTAAVGSNTGLAVRGGATSAHAALGFTVGQQAAGTGGQPATFYLKRESGFVTLEGAALAANALVNATADILTFTAVAEDASGASITYEDLGFHRDHPRYAGRVLAQNPTRKSEALENPYWLDVGANVNAFELRSALFGGGSRDTVLLSEGGNDGGEPSTNAYAAALRAFEALEDISIVAAPGYSALPADVAAGIQNAIISHVERPRAYRIGVLDARPRLTPGEVRADRARIDSKYAAMYYPWVVTPNPLFGPSDESQPREISMPPSGFICGIYARNDIEKSVSKAPANEIVRGALRFETDINFAQQESLNPIGVNCLRYLSGRGFRVWGARTATSDPEWKYVNLRRYFNYLEASIDRGTQWAVFENNGERLWRNVRETLSGFLYNEWVSGNLLGSKPEEAYFVRCDRSTMTQNDLDNGRLICLIGVAALRPAEFVIFRIGQKTVDFKG